MAHGHEKECAARPLNEDGNKDCVCSANANRARVIRDERAKGRRERIATACLAGLLASGVYSKDPAVVALEHANALIRELDK